MHDMEVISKLEKLLDIKFEHCDELSANKCSFTTESEGVVGISIRGVDLSEASAHRRSLTFELLKGLKRLKELYLMENEIIDISPLRELKQITGLIISENKIADISPLQDMKELEWVNISSNRVHSFSPLWELNKLEWLSACNNEIIDIKSLRELKHLSYLKLNDNQIADVTQLRELTQLTQLDISVNQIADVSPLRELTQLTQLSLNRNQIADVAPLRELTLLTQLHLSYNQVADVAPLRELTQLTQLHLSYNQIADVAPLKELTQLSQLDLNNNQIADVAPLRELTQLSQLYLRNNQIADVAPLRELTQLTQLHLSYNQIADVSPLRELTQLSQLYLSNNQIADVSPLKELTRLSDLDVRENILTKIPVSLISHFNFISVDSEGIIDSWDSCFFIAENPLIDPPVEIIKHGREAVLRYFERKEKEKFTQVHEVKLIFVGEGAAGKTSLKLRLDDPSATLPSGDERTRGIDVTKWHFEDNYTARIWDFGGQNVYYPVHRFFLTENAVFLLLASTRNKQHNFEYWIPTIFQFGGDSPIIISQTCHDGSKEPWNELSLYSSDKTFNIVGNGSTDFFPINLKNNNEGLDEIKSEIIHQIKKLPQTKREIPESWVAVRNELEAIDTFCIHYAGFKELCRTINPDSFNWDVDFLDCCRFLHSTGSVYWYHTNVNLKDWVVLKPELAVEAVYKIIDDEKIQSRRGHIENSDFLRLWDDKHLEDYHFVLKEMLKEFKVAFSKKHDKDAFILPTLLESIPQEKNWTEQPCITSEFDYNFMPKGLTNQLSAELSGYISLDGSEEVWNNAVNLVYEDTAKCQVKEDFFNRRIIVKASGKDARGLMMLVRDSLTAITAMYKKVVFDEVIPCNCRECENAVEHVTKHNYSDLIRLYRDKGRTNAYCQESDTRIAIDELIFNVGLPFVPREDSGVNKMKKIKIFLASSKELEVERREFEIFINRENKRLFDEGVFIHLEIWEDFIDAVSKTRLQDEYNEAVRNSDIFISMFFTKAGKYTDEEFEAAYGQFIKSGKPFVYTYIKNAPVNYADIKKEDFESLNSFKEKMEAIGHFPTEFTSSSDLTSKFKAQFEKLKGKL